MLALPARGQSVSCLRGSLLPAYAHNDYANPRPLYEALELGFRGVEADVLLRGGELRVGHDAGQSRSGRSLEALYLAPLRRIARQCGRVAGQIPFLLNIELKERSNEGFDSLVAMIARYVDLVEPAGVGDTPPVEIVLVGWHPPPGEIPSDRSRLFRIQQRVTSGNPAEDTRSAAVRLVSLDYGKTIGWSGGGPVPTSAATWLARVGAAKQAGPGRIARAYNVPLDSAVYRLLLDGGIDLLGSKRLGASRALLLAMNISQGP